MASYYEELYEKKFDELDEFEVDLSEENLSTEKGRRSTRFTLRGNVRAQINERSFAKTAHFVLCESLIGEPLTEKQRNRTSDLNKYRELRYKIKHANDIKKEERISRVKSAYNTDGVTEAEFEEMHRESVKTDHQYSRSIDAMYGLKKTFSSKQLEYGVATYDPKEFTKNLTDAMLNYASLKEYHESKTFLWKLGHFGKNWDINRTLSNYEKTFKKLGIGAEDIKQCVDAAKSLEILDTSFKGRKAAQEQLLGSCGKIAQVCRERFQAIDKEADLSFLPEEQKPEVQNANHGREPLDENERILLENAVAENQPKPNLERINEQPHKGEKDLV